MYLKQRALGGAGGSLSTQNSRAAAENNYLKDAEQLLSEHNLYKIYFVSFWHILNQYSVPHRVVTFTAFIGKPNDDFSSSICIELMLRIEAIRRF